MQGHVVNFNATETKSLTDRCASWHVPYGTVEDELRQQNVSPRTRPFLWKDCLTDQMACIVLDDRLQVVSRCDELGRVGQENQGDFQSGQAVGEERRDCGECDLEVLGPKRVRVRS